MATRITSAHLAKARDHAMRLHRRASEIASKTRGTVETIVRSSEVGASAFGLGMVQGRYGQVEVVGVPMELLLAIGLHGAGMLGLGGDLSGHLHSFGDGALATYGANLGRSVGSGMREKAGLPPASTNELAPDLKSRLPGGTGSKDKADELRAKGISVPAGYVADGEWHESADGLTRYKIDPETGKLDVMDKRPGAAVDGQKLNPDELHAIAR